MARSSTTLIARMADGAMVAATAHPVQIALFGIAAGFAAFLWVFAVAPPLVFFALTVAMAVAWCVWLESHPDAAGGHEPHPRAGGRRKQDRHVVMRRRERC